MAHRLIIKLAKSVIICAASVAMATLFARTPPEGDNILKKRFNMIGENLSMFFAA